LDVEREELVLVAPVSKDDLQGRGDIGGNILTLPGQSSRLLEDDKAARETETLVIDAPVTRLDDLPVESEDKQRPGHRDHAAFRSVRRIVILGDVLCALVVFAVVINVTSAWVWVMPAAWLAAALLCTSRGDRMADLLDRRPFLKMNSHLAFAVVILSVTIGKNQNQITREVLFASAGLAFGGLVVRTVVKFLANRGRWITQVTETVLVVGRMESVRRTIAEWRDLNTIDVVGACLGSEDPDVAYLDGVPVLGRVTEVSGVARQLGVDIVALHDVEQLGGLQLARLQYALEEVGAQMSVITPVTNMVVARASVRRLGRRVVMDVSYGKPRGLARVCKTAIDQLLSLLLLTIGLPIMLVCGALVRLTSPGPAMFKQIRVGEGGSTFVMYKLRTMRIGAESELDALLEQNEVGGRLFKITEDPRMTRMGKFLRRFSLDELPQLFNVLKGEMSLIGPRPALPREVQTYDDAARRRLAVKPGMTGLWQVSGRSNLTWDQSVRLDSDYVDNWNAGRELSIAFRTVKAIITRDGAH